MKKTRCGVISANDFAKFTDELEMALENGYAPIGPAQVCYPPDPMSKPLYTITLTRTDEV